MQEDEETGVAESWQEIIFRVHQPPPAQSAEKKLSSRLSTEDGGESCGRARGREQRAQANRHMFTYLRLSVKLSRGSLDLRCHRHRILCVEGHIYLQQSSKLSSRCPPCLQVAPALPKIGSTRAPHVNISTASQHTGTDAALPTVADSRQAGSARMPMLSSVLRTATSECG